MDKITVNNKVVSMRKFVKQAKLYTINKLVKKHKRLQQKKGTEEQLAKNKRKEERLTEEINIIKKIPVDEVSRKALMKVKDWSAALLSKDTSLNDRSFAMLANFGPLQNEVNKFHKDHSRLVNLLPDFFEEWDAKKSNPMHQDLRKLKALEAKLKRKEKKSKLKNKTPNNKDFLSKKEVLDSGSVLKSTKKSLLNKESNLDTCQNISENQSNEPDFENELVERHENDFNDGPISENKEKNSSSIQSGELNNFKGNKQKKEIAILSLDQLQNQEKSDEEDADSEEEVEVKKIKKDPFFVSADETFSDDDNIVERLKQLTQSSDNRSGNGKFKKDFPNKKLATNWNSKQNYHKNKPDRKFMTSKMEKKPFEKRTFSPKEKFSHSSSKFSKGNKMNFREHKKDDKFNKRSSFQKMDHLTSDNTGLHPSWEAKRKLKQQNSQILPFQGKKIIFE